jgi:hypothetical protein
MGVINLAKGNPAPDLDFPLRSIASFIDKMQAPDGAIPWGKGRHVDPWNHIEAAMGLSVGGYHESAERAYLWLHDGQLRNGGWWSRYEGGCSSSNHMETNFIAYVATGVWHHYSIVRKYDFLDSMWCMVDAALNCVVACQHKNGMIGWEIDASGQVAPGALLTGCASICRSLDCGLLIASVLGHQRPRWAKARELLGKCVRQPQQGFMNKSRYAMDWFYPILSGMLSREQMHARLDSYWEEFVEKDLGCLCVLDEPWVAVAESCELAIALQAAGRTEHARQLYQRLHRLRDQDGGYWTGYQYRLAIPWPGEKTTWTAGAILLAYDALYNHTPAADLFLTPATAQ